MTKTRINTDSATDPYSVAVAFRSSRRKTLLLAAGLIAIAALVAAAAIIVPLMWPWLVVAYFGLMAVAVLWNGLLRPATLRLDADGVHFAHWRYIWSIQWGDIADVQLSALRINWCIVSQNVVLRDEAGTKRRISAGLTITPAELAWLIGNQWRSSLAAIPNRAGDNVESIAEPSPWHR